MAETNLVRFRAAVEGALAHLESRRQEVNDLNVFPVADGDTGDNMVLTLRAVLTELDRLSGEEGERTVDEIGREEIVDSVARAALLGARGNSGVILSQLIRGAAEELVSRPGELVDPVLIGAAMARAADRAYDSVRDPAEGTILTVVREMAHRVATDLAHLPDTRLGPDAEPDEQDTAIADVLEGAIDAGQESVKRGPELLPVLREAGVVDAGGYGLVIVFAGVVAALRGAEPPELEHHAPARITHPQHESLTYRYCTNFVVTGTDLDPSRYLRELEGLGAKDGRQQTCGALAVVAGAGMKALFEGLGVHALDGGPTLNPSTYDLLAGIHSVPAEEVIVLPNSPNVIMAAERAAGLSEKRVRVVATRSQQAGLAAAVALEPGRHAPANAQAMEEELEHVRTGAVARAARDDAGGRFHTGDAVGYVGEDLVAWGDPEATLRDVLARLGDGAELLTCIAGDGAPLDGAQVGALAPDGVELEHSVGGQPNWWWLLAAE